LQLEKANKAPIVDVTINGLSDSAYDESNNTQKDKPAMFPGGPRAFGAFLQRNLKYPSAAQRANLGGKVYVQFVVNIDGTTSDYKIINSVGYGCDEEALRVIKSVSRWEPKVLNGEKVSSVFTQGITFVVSE
jgi:protein TonB